MAGRCCTGVIDAPAATPQVVAATLTLATVERPPELKLGEHRPTKKRCPHGDVARDTGQPALIEVIRGDRNERRPAAELLDQRAHAAPVHRNVIVEIHEPRSRAACAPFIARTGDCLITALIVNIRLTAHTVEYDAHALLLIEASLHFRMQWHNLPRQHDNVHEGKVVVNHIRCRHSAKA